MNTSVTMWLLGIVALPSVLSAGTGGISIGTLSHTQRSCNT